MSDGNKPQSSRYDESSSSPRPPQPTPWTTKTTTESTTTTTTLSSRQPQPTTTTIVDHRVHHPSRDNCERRRLPGEDIPPKGLVKMPSELVGKTLSPFLKEHIPDLYAPVGKNIHDETHFPKAMTSAKDTNTRLCYRHRPDSKCRRAADETKMGFIQRVRFPIHITSRQVLLFPQQSILTSHSFG